MSNLTGGKDYACQGEMFVSGSFIVGKWCIPVPKITIESGSGEILCHIVAPLECLSLDICNFPHSKSYLKLLRLVRKQLGETVTEITKVNDLKYTVEFDMERPTVLTYMILSGSYLFAHIKFNNDYDLVMAAVSTMPPDCDRFWPLKHASKQLQNNKDLVLVAVETDGTMLEFASEQLQDDKDVVMIAVTDEGCSLEFVSDRLKDDDDVVSAAISNSSEALRYSSTRLFNIFRTHVHENF